MKECSYEEVHKSKVIGNLICTSLGFKILKIDQDLTILEVRTPLASTCTASFFLISEWDPFKSAVPHWYGSSSCIGLPTDRLFCIMVAPLE